MNRLYWITVSFLFLSYIWLLFWGITCNSPVQSEDALLASGVSHYKFHRFDLYRVNPPLVRLCAAFPIKKQLSEAKNGWWRYDPNPIKRAEFIVGVDLVQSHPDYKLLIQQSRLWVALPFGVLGLLISIFYAKQFFGQAASIAAILLWCFCPYILAHGVTIVNDVPSASMALAAVFFFHRWLRQPAGLEALLAGIILGLAELTKFTLLIFYPLFIILWLLYRKPTFAQLKQLAVIFAMSLLVINMGYLFEDTGKQLGNFKFQTTFFTGCENLKDIPVSGDNRFKNSILGKIPVPLPANFVQGIDTQRRDFERGLPSYLRGEHSQHGWRCYYLYALLIKTPLGVLALFILAIVCSFFRNFNVSWRDEMVILLPGIVLLAFVSSQNGFSVHSRYVIPALPFFFVWMSKVGKCFTLRKQCLSVVVSILMVWSIFSSLWIYPHSLSYFNELAAIIPTPLESRAPQEPAGTLSIVSILNAGARNGGRHLLESNIDWGQDIFYLEKWCQKHPDITKIYTALSGSYPLEQTKIPHQPILSVEKFPSGWYAISVNYLYGKEETYRQFLDMQPVARIGFSIYIYRVP